MSANREAGFEVVSIVPLAPTLAERAPLVTPDERDAVKAFEHLGLPEPPSFAWARVVLGCSFEGEERERTTLLLRGEDEASPRRVALPGRLFHWACTEAYLVMALAVGERCQIAWLPKDEGSLALSPLLDVRPRALRFLCASPVVALLGVDSGAGEVRISVNMPH
jgi:hypothetical protein